MTGLIDIPADWSPHPIPANAEGHHGHPTGRHAPDFTADTTEGTINFHEWLGDGWGVLFSHPKDFTPVCTTELGYVAKLKPEFDKRNVKVIGLSVDSVDDHEQVGGRHRGDAGHCGELPDDRRPRQEGRRPLRHDPPERERHRHGALRVRHRPRQEGEAHDHLPAVAGRNFDEILRVIDSLQLTAGYSVATPVNWKDGEDVIIMPSVSDDDAKGKFPKGWKAIKPYLRLTPQPNK